MYSRAARKRTCSGPSARRRPAAGFSTAGTEIAIQAYIDQANTGPFDPHETLTPRQREVLQMVAEGKTNGEIAVLLHISPRTVENHRAALMQKLGIQNQTELIHHAMRHGLIPPEES